MSSVFICCSSPCSEHGLTAHCCSLLLEFAGGGPRRLDQCFIQMREMNVRGLVWDQECRVQLQKKPDQGIITLHQLNMNEGIYFSTDDRRIELVGVHPSIAVSNCSLHIDKICTFTAKVKEYSTLYVLVHWLPEMSIDSSCHSYILPAGLSSGSAFIHH